MVVGDFTDITLLLPWHCVNGNGFPWTPTAAVGYKNHCWSDVQYTCKFFFFPNC